MVLHMKRSTISFVDGCLLDSKKTKPIDSHYVINLYSEYLRNICISMCTAIKCIQLMQGNLNFINEWMRIIRVLCLMLSIKMINLQFKCNPIYSSYAQKNSLALRNSNCRLLNSLSLMKK